MQKFLEIGLLGHKWAIARKSKGTLFRIRAFRRWEESYTRLEAERGQIKERSGRRLRGLKLSVKCEPVVEVFHSHLTGFKQLRYSEKYLLASKRVLLEARMRETVKTTLLKRFMIEYLSSSATDTTQNADALVRLCFESDYMCMQL